MSGEFVLDGRFREQWVAAGLGGELIEVLDGYQRRVADLREQRDADFEAARKAELLRVRSLTTGAPSKRPAAPPAAWDIAAALKEVGRNAMRAVREIGDRLITEQLAPAHRALLDEAQALAPLVGGLRDDRDAVRRTTPEASREAWVALAGVWERRTALVELLRALVGDRAVPAVRRDDEESRLFAFPERGRLPYDGRRRMIVLTGDSPPPARLMADLVLDEHGREPGMFTLGQVADNAARADDEARTAAEAAEMEGLTRSEMRRRTRGQDFLEARYAVERQQHDQAHVDAEWATTRPRPRTPGGSEPSPLTPPPPDAA